MSGRRDSEGLCFLLLRTSPLCQGDVVTRVTLHSDSNDDATHMY